MSYHIYQTRGFVVSSVNIAEADRMIFVFTESMGLLSVNVRAARKISSKLRYSLQNYSFARIALVRGKNVWRLTDAEELAAFRKAGESQKLKLLAGVFSLVNRFVHGEGENPALFRSLKDLCDFLQKEELAEEEIFLVEALTACRILSALGYIGESAALAPFLNGSISKGLLGDFLPYQSEARREISRALKESQL